MKFSTFVILLLLFPICGFGVSKKMLKGIALGLLLKNGGKQPQAIPVPVPMHA